MFEALGHHSRFSSFTERSSASQSLSMYPGFIVYPTLMYKVAYPCHLDDGFYCFGILATTVYSYLFIELRMTQWSFHLL